MANISGKSIKLRLSISFQDVALHLLKGTKGNSPLFDGKWNPSFQMFTARIWALDMVQICSR